jgi:all-trans-retinol 13,14-reductase
MPLFAFVHSQKSFIQSSWRLKGDSSQIVRSLTDDIRRMGGEVVCRAEVQELVEHNGLLTTARCSNGEEYQGRCFISDIHPALTVSLVKESQRMKKVFRRRISALENTAGLYTWSLVLKPQTLRYFNHNKYVYRGGSVWDDATERVAISCRVPDDGSDYATLLDLMTTGAADPLPLAECVLPGLRDMVSEQYVSSPATWQRFTHTPDGSAFGVRNDYRNSLMTMLSPMTPIPNLLLTGQSLALPGVEGVVMTALETLRLIGSLGVWEFRSMGV